jgi:hypothetical protein
MRLLVIGSCTGEKEIHDCPCLLTEADFDDPLVLRRREAELSAWGLPPTRLYAGWQHRYMTKGIDAIRQRFGASCCTLKIISAGYGLVDEHRMLVPYEATFQGRPEQWVCERAQKLGIPQAIRESAQGYEVVVFLLGKEYLLSTHPPLAPDLNQRFVFFSSNLRIPFDPDSTVIPAGKGETRFGAGMVSLKGKMFELFAYGLCSNPEMWTHVLADKTPASVLNLIEAGRSGGSVASWS